MLSIQTNVNSMNAQENLRVTNQFQGRTIARLTSGYRINESGDDAAGLAVANKYRSDVTELVQGVRNANDGLSTLQIIDGGLNNISKILDRLKTLATQSASDTFTGNRATLDAEYQSLLGEIDRQAANIGLGVGDENATKHNTSIEVYLGGGSSSGNSKLSVDLSASSNVVNATGLSLTGSSISGNMSLKEFGDTDIRSGKFLTNGSQQFVIQTASLLADGNNNGLTLTVNGDSDGMSGNEVVAELNRQLASNNVNVTISINGTTGRLQASSTEMFMIGAVTGTGVGVTSGAASVTAARTAAVSNNAFHVLNGGDVSAVTVDNTTLTLTSGGESHSITLDSATQNSVAAMWTEITTELTNASSDKVKYLRMGDHVVFYSASTITGERDAGGAGVAAGGVAIAEGAAAFTAAYASSAVPTDKTQNALAALSAVQDAVTRLGNVQGKVGTGQNRLSYAIQLAQSQITSFSAAESRIRDADVASEAANLTKAQVLQQASLAALAQANSAPQAVLSLLRG